MPYAKPIVTLDIDGVLANTGYVPKGSQSTWTAYANAKPFPLAYELLHWFQQNLFEVWFLSARSFPGAQALTESWVHQHFGNLNSWYHKKVLTGLHDESVPKYAIANELGSKLHVDDDWRVCLETEVRKLNVPDLYSAAWHVDKLRPFTGTFLLLDNWKDKTKIPDIAYDLVDDSKLWLVPDLQEAIELIQTLTPKLLGKSSRK